MENIKIRRYKSPRTISKVAKDCVNNNLYVNGWSMHRYFTNYETYIHEIYVLKIENDLVGAAVILKKDTPDSYRGHNIATFIKNNHRRKGYGSHLIKKALKHNQLVAAPGIQGSESFFGKNKIPMVR